MTCLYRLSISAVGCIKAGTPHSNGKSTPHASALADDDVLRWFCLFLQLDAAKLIHLKAMAGIDSMWCLSW